MSYCRARLMDWPAMVLAGSNRLHSTQLDPTWVRRDPSKSSTTKLIYLLTRSIPLSVRLNLCLGFQLLWHNSLLFVSLSKQAQQLTSQSKFASSSVPQQLTRQTHSISIIWQSESQSIVGSAAAIESIKFERVSLVRLFAPSFKRLANKLDYKLKKDRPKQRQQLQSDSFRRCCCYCC